MSSSDSSFSVEFVSRACSEDVPIGLGVNVPSSLGASGAASAAAPPAAAPPAAGAAPPAPPDGTEASLEEPSAISCS